MAGTRAACLRSSMEPSTDPVAERASAVLEAVLGATDALTIAIGTELGYYRALDHAGATGLTPAGLAVRVGASERYTREWLEQQAVAGFLLAGEPTTGEERRFRLAPGTAEVLAWPDALTTMAPLATMVAAAGAQWRRIVAGARTGSGLGWSEYGPDMMRAQADVNAPPLRTLLPDAWLRDALPATHARLESGEALLVADVGCGAGWASVGLARRWPRVRVHAYDVDPATVALAREVTASHRVADRVEVRAHDIGARLPEERYDLTLAVECVHDLPHPVPVLAAMREMTRPDGAVLVVDEKVADRFTAPGDEVERLMYGYSTLICLPDAMTGNPEHATGTVIRRPTMQRYAREAGFTDALERPVEHDMWRFYELTRDSARSTSSATSAAHPQDSVTPAPP